MHGERELLIRDIPTPRRRISAPARGVVVHGAGSRLRDPKVFFRDWLADLRSCETTAWRLFLRHLAQQYRFSSLGLLWAFAPSALAAIVLIGGERTHVVGANGGVSAAFYGVFGLSMAQTFLEALNSTRRVFANHQQLLRRQNVPLDGLIVAAFIETAFSLLVRILVVCIVFFLFSIRPSPTTAGLAVIGLVGVALAGAGLGLLIAPLNSLKRDVENMFTFLPWVLFAVTPIFVPAQAGTVFERICGLNPLAHVFDGIRAAAYGAPGDPMAAIYGVIAGLLLVFMGWLVCRIARPHVVERMLG